MMDIIFNLNKMIFKNVFIVSLIVILFFVNLLGYKTVLNEEFVNIDLLKQLKAEFDYLEAENVYFYGNSTQNDAQSIRGIDETERIYDCIFEDMTMVNWGNSIRNRNNDLVKKNTVIVAEKELFNRSFPVYYRDKFNFIKEIGGYEIYCNENEILHFANNLPKLNEKKIIYPYTIGMKMENENFSMNGEFISSNTGGYIMWGPYVQIKKGNYKFILNYEVLNNTNDDVGFFEVSTDLEELQSARTNLEKNNKSVMVENISFKNNKGIMEYRVYITPGTVIKIKSLEIIRIE